MEARRKNLANALRREPNISQIDVDAEGTISVETSNIQTLTVKYYLINAELLFSRSPFLQDNTESFSYVMPY